MPAERRPRLILRDQRLLECVGPDAQPARGPQPQIGKKVRNVRRGRPELMLKVIPRAVVHRTTARGVLTVLRMTERQRADDVEQRLLLFDRDEVRLVLQAGRPRGRLGRDRVVREERVLLHASFDPAGCGTFRPDARPGLPAGPAFVGDHSGNVTPEPPISAGMSFIFGLPSLMRSTVSW